MAAACQVMVTAIQTANQDR